MLFFEKRTALSVSAADLFAWHERPSAFDDLTPTWARVRVLKPLAAFREGETTSFQVQTPLFPITWLARIQEIVPGRQFVDVQISGPFSKWRHLHLFEPQTDRTCCMHDRVEYQLPFGPLGKFFKNKVNRDLERLFKHRHNKLIELFGAA